MYSPKIAEHLIPSLYRLRCERRQPMTRLVAEAIEQYLAAAGALPMDAEPRERYGDRSERPGGIATGSR
ncbi:MAG: hypothetical protein AB7T16_12970 [Dehalococcoidia bacterium]